MYRPNQLPQTGQLPPLPPQGAEIPAPRAAQPSEYAAWTPPPTAENTDAMNAAPEAAATPSLRERMGEHLDFAVKVAKRVGRAAVEGVISMDRSDRDGTATDAHVPRTERVVDRAEKSRSLPEQGSEQEQNDRAGMWARRIIKGAGYAITAAKIYNTYRKFKKGAK